MGTGPVVAEGRGRGEVRFEDRLCCIREVGCPTGAEMCRSREGADGTDEAKGALCSTVNQSRREEQWEYIHGRYVSAWVPSLQTLHRTRIA